MVFMEDQVLMGELYSEIISYPFSPKAVEMANSQDFCYLYIKAVLNKFLGSQFQIIFSVFYHSAEWR